MSNTSSDESNNNTKQQHSNFFQTENVNLTEIKEENAALSTTEGITKQNNHLQQQTIDDFQTSTTPRINSKEEEQDSKDNNNNRGNLLSPTTPVDIGAIKKSSTFPSDRISTIPSTVSINTDYQPLEGRTHNNNSHISLSTYSDITSSSTKEGGGKLEVRTILRTLRNASEIEFKETLKISSYIKNHKFVWMFLTICGFLGGLLSFAHDMIIKYIGQGRSTMIGGLDENQFLGLRLFLWVVYNLAFVYLGLLLTIFIAPAAEGSGIPPVKAILNGATLKDPLSLKTLIVKFFALPAVLGSGMFLGKVGPTIHCGAMLANNLMLLKIFRPIRKIKQLKLQMIASGGVLFALEAVGTYYSLRNYLKSFYIAVVAAYTSRLFTSLVNLNLYMLTNWSVKMAFPSFTIPELIAYAILGIILGFLGVGFVSINEKLLQLRDRFGKLYFGFFKLKKLQKYKFMLLFENRVIWTVFICIVTSIVTFPQVVGKFMSLSTGVTVEELFSSQPLGEANGWIKNNQTDVFSSLAVFILIRAVLSCLSVSLPIPGGVYVPLLVIGAGCGRFFGECVALIFPRGFLAGQPIIPGSYAVVGAVCLTASATQAFSTVFILLEVVGIGVYMPALMAAIIAVRISRILSYSVYDSIIKIRAWPALLENLTDSDYVKVKNLMYYIDSLVILEETMSLYDIGKVFDRPSLPKTLAVVNDKDQLLLLGRVSLKSLESQYKIRKARFEERLKQSKGVSSPQQGTSVSHLPTKGSSQFTTANTIEGTEVPVSVSNISSPLVVELSDKEIMELEKKEMIEIEYDSCDVTVSESQPATVAHMLFCQLALDDVFVVWKGRLMGQLVREMLIKTVADKQKKKAIESL
ncbi:hypothetical protein ABK040_001057 [Willaertia magna]